MNVAAEPVAPAAPAANWPLLELSALSLRQLEVVKVSLSRSDGRDHCRWVFRQAGGPAHDRRFYKIWNPTYVRRDNILHALAAGFYDRSIVPALDGIIVHEGVCRGYAMKEGRLCAGLLDEPFRELVCRKTASSGYLFVQLNGHHVMLYRGEKSLLDLEAVYPLHEFPQLRRYGCELEDSAYAAFVENLHRRAFAAAGPEGPLPGTGDRSLAGTAGDKPGIATRIARLFRRRVMREVRNRFPRLDRIVV